MRKESVEFERWKYYNTTVVAYNKSEFSFIETKKKYRSIKECWKANKDKYLLIAVGLNHAQRQVIIRDCDTTKTIELHLKDIDHLPSPNNYNYNSKNQHIQFYWFLDKPTTNDETYKSIIRAFNRDGGDSNYKGFIGRNCYYDKNGYVPHDFEFRDYTIEELVKYANIDENTTIEHKRQATKKENTKGSRNDTTFTLALNYFIKNKDVTEQELKEKTYELYDIACTLLNKENYNPNKKTECDNIVKSLLRYKRIGTLGKGKTYNGYTYKQMRRGQEVMTARAKENRDNRYRIIKAYFKEEFTSQGIQEKFEDQYCFSKTNIEKVRRELKIRKNEKVTIRALEERYNIDKMKIFRTLKKLEIDTKTLTFEEADKIFNYKQEEIKKEIEVLTETRIEEQAWLIEHKKIYDALAWEKGCKMVFEENCYENAFYDL